MQWAAFVRAINLGKRNKVSKDELSAAFADAGGCEVSTFLQTGNVLFRATEGAVQDVVDGAETRLTEMLGTPIPVMLRRVDELQALVGEHPYPKPEAEPTEHFYVSFLHTHPAGGVVLPDDKPHLEFVGQQGLQVFSVMQRSARGSSPNELLERNLGVYVTSRNWNTVVRLMARA